MWRPLILLILLPFLCSCNNPVEAREYSNTKELAYRQTNKAEVRHTKHVRKQQKDICKRLKKIQKRLEKAKKKNKG
jgi:Flp pilus assembly protein TadB